MKKTLLAAALVTGFAGVAQAESSVTLYGLVDGGYGYQQVETKFRGDYPGGKISNDRFRAFNGVMNGNRWGLKGSEDLGNGTSAIFVLESGFDLGNGESIQGGRLFGRQAYVGLTSESWGTFSIGRQYNAGEAFVAAIDPFGTGGGFAAANSIFGNSIFDRYDGVVKYVSPTFSGFKFAIAAIHEDNETEYKFDDPSISNYKVTSRTSGVSTGLGYTNGPLYIGATFDYQDVKRKDSDATPNPLDSRSKTKAWNIGGTYDFDVVKLHLLYGGLRDGSIGGVGMLAATAVSNSPLAKDNRDAYATDGLKQHSWLAGLTAPVGDAGTLMFSYAGNTGKNDKLEGIDSFKVKSHNFGLGYRHNLSKRTSVYGVASYGWSEAKERGSENVPTGTGKTKVTATQAIIGLQHRF